MQGRSPVKMVDVMSHVRRPRHHRASTRRLAGARPDGVHRGWIHPLHDRAVDVSHLLSTPVHWGVFVTAATPWKCARTLRFRPAQSIPRRRIGFWQFLARHTPAPPHKPRTEWALFTFRDLALFLLVPALFP